MKSVENKRYVVIFLAIIVCIFLSSNLTAVTDKNTGVSFPETVSFSANGNDYDLSITGVSTRKKFFVNVYSVASYLQKDANANASNVMQMIMNPSYAKQLSFVWLRNIDANKVQDGYRSAFRKAVPNAKREQLSSEIEQFIALFSQGVKKGGKDEIRFIPDGTVIVVIEGSEAGTIKSQEFADALLSIWFSSNSAVDRDRLVSEVK